MDTNMDMEKAAQQEREKRAQFLNEVLDEEYRRYAREENEIRYMEERRKNIEVLLTLEMLKDEPDIAACTALGAELAAAGGNRALADFAMSNASSSEAELAAMGGSLAGRGLFESFGGGGDDNDLSMGRTMLEIAISYQMAQLSVMMLNAFRGDKELVQRLDDISNGTSSESFYEIAAASGNADILRAVADTGLEMNRSDVKAVYSTLDPEMVEAIGVYPENLDVVGYSEDGEVECLPLQYSAEALVEKLKEAGESGESPEKVIEMQNGCLNQFTAIMKMSGGQTFSGIVQGGNTPYMTEEQRVERLKASALAISSLGAQIQKAMELDVTGNKDRLPAQLGVVVAMEEKITKRLRMKDTSIGNIGNSMGKHNTPFNTRKVIETAEENIRTLRKTIAEYGSGKQLIGEETEVTEVEETPILFELQR